MRSTLEAPPLAASEGAKVGSQPLAVGVLGSYGGSAGLPVLLPGSVPAPGSGTRFDARVKPIVNKECGSLLPMWRDAVRSLTVDTAAYDSVIGYVLGTLSISATVCENMELVAVLSSALLRKCGGDIAYLVSAVGSPSFTPHNDVARVQHWFGEVKGFPQISRLLQVFFPGARVVVAPGGDLQPKIAYGNHPSSESHTGTIRAKIFSMS